MRRIAGRERLPRADMSADDVVDLVDLFDEIGVGVWLDGGWGIDALLGSQTRPHDDLDVVVELSDVDTLQRALAERGYVLVGGGAPMSFELTDDDGRQIDVHPVVFNGDGDGVYRTRNGENWLYPASGFAGVGSVLRRRVRCLTPEIQMLTHTGYELDSRHRSDVAALSRRFGIPTPYVNQGGNA